MAKFQINSHVPIEDICLDSTAKPGGGQRRVTLQLAGWAGGGPPELAGGGHFARVVSTSHNARSHLTTFTIEAVNGAKGVTYFYDGLSGNNQGAMLRVTVGAVTNHGGFQSDLIAELLGRSENPTKLWVYERILAPKNNDTAIPWAQWDRLLADQPLKQITDPATPARWDCGAALINFGVSYFGTDHHRFASARYYKPFHSTNSKEPNKVADIRFDDAVVSRGAEKIRQLLAKNVAVTVFVAHNDGFHANKDGEIQQSGDTHYVTIVGCDSAGTKFLFTDPWPGGSRLLYTSGILGTVDSAFMGLLEFFQRGGSSIASSASANRGAHSYVVLTGPT